MLILHLKIIEEKCLKNKVHMSRNGMLILHLKINEEKCLKNSVHNKAYGFDKIYKVIFVYIH